MWSLLTQSYWRDEAFSVLLASRKLEEIFGLVVKFDHTPPLFYYLQHGWIGLFGSGEIATRSLSVLFYGLIIYFVYQLSRSRLAALAVFLNPFLWQYALEARHYSAFTAMVLAGIYFYQAKKFSLSNFCWAAALWTHNFAWLYFLTFAALNRAKKLLPALVIGAVWLPFAWQQINSLNQGMWLGLPTGPWWWNSLKAFTVNPLLTWLLLGLLVSALVRPTKLLLVALLPPLLTYLISRLWVPVYLERYLLPTLPLVIAAGWPIFRRLGAIFVLVSALAFIQVNQETTKPAMRQAVAMIISQIQPEEIIVTEQPINYLEMYYYLQAGGLQERLYSHLYPGEDEIPYYVGTGLIKPWPEIVAVPEGRPAWLVKPDGSVLKYE